VRFRLAIGIAYGSDVEKVREILLAAAREHPAALREPEPVVFLRWFWRQRTELRAWCLERGNGAAARGDSAAI